MYRILSSTKPVICLIVILLQFGNVFCQSAQSTAVTIRYVDPLRKVLKTDADFKDEPAFMDAARGEVASLQFVVRSKDNIKGLKVTVSGLTNQGSQLPAQVRYVGQVKVTAVAKDAASDKIVSGDMLYPDPLLEDAQMDVASNTSQAVWLSVTIPLNAKPGIYNGKLVVDGTTAGGTLHEQRDFQIIVYAVQLKTPELSVSIWPFLENPRIAASDKLVQLTGDKTLAAFSDKYWVLVKKMAEMMHRYYQNVIVVYPIHTIVYTYTNGKYGFDFTNLDKTISIYKAAGVNGRIEGSFLGGRNGNWWQPFSLFYYMKGPDGQVKSMSGDLKNPDLVNFYKQYIPALVAHLKSKNWYKDYYQHIADEPIDTNSDSYMEYYKFVKSLAPDLKIMEAVQTLKLSNDIDVFIPQLEFLKSNYNFYKKRIDNGKEVWFYVCWLPQGEYANRFIELPLIKTRLLHWINYKYGLKGYQHWAYNAWPADVMSPNRTGAKGELPTGDAWIVYPKKDGFLSSIRLEAMRDGIVDYELLKMLSAKNKGLSNEISSSIVKDFDVYETDIVRFRKARAKLLQELSH